MQTETTIDILRHGECEGGQIYRGSTDVALSETGWQQMRERATLTVHQWQKIISSPLQRCAHFATELADRHSLTVEQCSDFRETHFGRWEGQLIEDVWSNDLDTVNAWFNDPIKHSPPDGEPTMDFINRVTSAFDVMVSEHREQHIGVITHGGVIRVLLAHVLKKPFNGFSTIDVPYACLSRVKVLHSDFGDFPQLAFHNLHLP